jgi:hypothetical protein
MLGSRKVTRLVSVAHQSSALAKCGRERAEDIHGWIKPLGESLISAPRSIQFIGFPFKYGEDGLRRIAAFDLSSEGVGGQVFAGLLLILFQGLFEDWLKVWSG